MGISAHRKGSARNTQAPRPRNIWAGFSAAGVESQLGTASFHVRNNARQRQQHHLRPGFQSEFRFVQKRASPVSLQTERILRRQSSACHLRDPRRRRIVFQRLFSRCGPVICGSSLSTRIASRIASGIFSRASCSARSPATAVLTSSCARSRARPGCQPQKLAVVHAQNLRHGRCVLLHPV